MTLNYTCFSQSLTPTLYQKNNTIYNCFDNQQSNELKRLLQLYAIQVDEIKELRYSHLLNKLIVQTQSDLIAKQELTIGIFETIANEQTKQVNLLTKELNRANKQIKKQVRIKRYLIIGIGIIAVTHIVK